jgi:hypothetical protein
MKQRVGYIPLLGIGVVHEAPGTGSLLRVMSASATAHIQHDLSPRWKE